MFFKSAPQSEELALHPVITDGPGGQEVLRAWNMNDGHQVFLVKPDAFEAFHRVLEGFMAELQNPTDQPETVAHQ